MKNNMISFQKYEIKQNIFEIKWGFLEILVKIKKFDLKFSNAKSLNQNNIINSSLWMGGRAA